MANSQRLLRTSLLSTIVVLTSLLLLASLRSGSTLFGQEPGSLSLEPGTDRQGLDYKSFEIDGGPEACQKACASEARCQAYTWTRPGVHGPKAVCWLKSGVPSPTSNANCVSGAKWSLLSLEPGTDRPGLDYKRLEIDGGPEACQNACASEARCQAYTWTRPGVHGPKAVCWLKYGVPSPTSNANCVSGAKWSLPQGLTGGLTYWIRDVVAKIGSVAGIATLTWQGERRSKPGWTNVSDGDRGLRKDDGFYHQELLAAGGGIRPATPDRLMLPAGTACGFHHTQNSPANLSTGLGTCMGMDPGRNACPNGWIARRHFDMSSGNGSRDCGTPEALGDPAACGYFVWCEYTDPYKLCEGPDCVDRATRMATVGIQSDTDATGATLRPECPSGTIRTPFFDSGRPGGKGLSFCLNSSAVPPQSPGALAGAFEFDVHEMAHYSITVTIKGDIINPSGTVGVKTFTKTVTKEGMGGGNIPQSVSFTVDGLMAGTWRVSASSNLTGPVLGCETRVPGYIGLSVAGGRGPRCL